MAYEVCKVLIEDALEYPWIFLPTAFVECDILEELILPNGTNPYDVRKNCSDENPLCYNTTLVNLWLNLESTRKALGVGSIPWKECDGYVYTFLIDDWIQSLAKDVVFLLSVPNYSLLVYSGVEDYICNYIGGKQWVSSLDWPGKDPFNKAPENQWKVNGTLAGISKSFKGLTWLEILNAGHLVPMDQPANALQMLYQFLNGIPFNSK